MTFSFPLLLGLVAAHMLCDYPLQGDFLARAKNHRSPIPGVPWYQALAAHSIIQAAAVTLLTGSIALGVGEFAMHAAIDYTIYDAPHGFREFGVQDPDGHDIAFGQPLEN